MQKIPDVFILLILMLTAYIPTAIILYRLGAASQDRESPHLASLLVVFGVTGLTLSLFYIAIQNLGIHGGFWLVAVVQVFVFDAFLVPWALKDSPDVVHYFQQWVKIAKCLGIGIFALLHLAIFWGISLAIGIAVQPIFLQFKM